MDGFMVRDLINALEQFDQNAEVLTPDGNRLTDIDLAHGIADVYQVTDKDGKRAVMITF
jgi:hypothetical protein